MDRSYFCVSKHLLKNKQKFSFMHMLNMIYNIQPYLITFICLLCKKKSGRVNLFFHIVYSVYCREFLFRFLLLFGFFFVTVCLGFFNFGNDIHISLSCVSYMSVYFAFHMCLATLSSHTGYVEIPQLSTRPKDKHQVKQLCT